MKEHPILFSTPMVQAILEGRKTQTRRIINCKKKIENPKFGFTAFTPKGSVSVRGKHESGEYGESFIKCPFGQVGDVLWVRETSIVNKNACRRFFVADGYHRSKSEETGKYFPHEKMVPSIFMPRMAARIFLKITKIRVERLQDISEADAKAEGAPCLVTDDNCESFWESLDGSFIGGFYKVWEKINGAASWDTNPFVWVIEFKKSTI